jgi:hypothetical protein
MRFIVLDEMATMNVNRVGHDDGKPYRYLLLSSYSMCLEISVTFLLAPE